jgi:PadR family transcriptional regulator AphA
MKKGNKTQYAILGVLSIQPMCGYEIRKAMDGSIRYFWQESNGQLYPTLANLAKNKLVSVETQTIGKKNRKVYSITTLGKSKLKDWLNQSTEYYPARNELVLKLFFGQNVPAKISIKHLENHIERCQIALKIYRDIETHLEAEIKQKTRPVYFLLAVKAGVKAVEAELDWCRESITLINKHK